MNLSVVLSFFPLREQKSNLSERQLIGEEARQYLLGIRNVLDWCSPAAGKGDYLTGNDSSSAWQGVIGLGKRLLAIGWKQTLLIL